MNIVQYYRAYFALSLLFLIPGIVSLVLFGVQPSIDFTGGTEIELQFSSNVVDESSLQELGADVLAIQSIQKTAEDTWLLKGESIDTSQKQQLLSNYQEEFGQVTELQFSQVGPSVSRELLQKTIFAVGIVSLIILVYVWRAFDEVKYGLCAIIAMFHDSLLLLGSFSILGYLYGIEVDVLFVTALLTTLSFSVHDTIVVFDRIRELSKKKSSTTTTNILNTAVIETLSRSINNSMTIIFMLLALSLLGGESIRWFAVALLIGAITGTYSSTFTAVPLLMMWDTVMKKK